MASSLTLPTFASITTILRLVLLMLIFPAFVPISAFKKLLSLMLIFPASTISENKSADMPFMLMSPAAICTSRLFRSISFPMVTISLGLLIAIMLLRIPLTEFCVIVRVPSANDVSGVRSFGPSYSTPVRPLSSPAVKLT